MLMLYGGCHENLLDVLPPVVSRGRHGSRNSDVLPVNTLVYMCVLWGILHVALP